MSGGQIAGSSAVGMAKLELADRRHRRRRGPGRLLEVHGEHGRRAALVADDEDLGRPVVVGHLEERAVAVDEVGGVPGLEHAEVAQLELDAVGLVRVDDDVEQAWHRVAGRWRGHVEVRALGAGDDPAAIAGIAAKTCATVTSEQNISTATMPLAPSWGRRPSHPSRPR